MNEQPEALRLAELLSTHYNIYVDTVEAAAELRRLHAEVERLRANLQPSVPDGWKLVPVEPTIKMVSEGSCAATLPGPRYIDESTAKKCWAYMLAAVPQPPVVEQEPVAWQCRMRADWGRSNEWWPWQECSREKAEDYKRVQYLNNWQYESRPLYTQPQPRIEPTGDEARRIYNEATYHASIAVFMTRMDAEHPDADEKGVSGWLQEAEDRVKSRITEAAHNIK